MFNSMRSKVILFSLITLIIGSIGYFVIWSHWIKYIFAHIGAVGIIWLFPPLILGIIAVYLVDPPKQGVLPESCGGIVSLGTALIVAIMYLATKKRKALEET